MSHEKLDTILAAVRAADDLDAVAVQLVESFRANRRRLEELEEAERDTARLVREANERLARIETLLRGMATEERARGH